LLNSYACVSFTNFQLLYENAVGVIYLLSGYDCYLVWLA